MVRASSRFQPRVTHHTIVVVDFGSQYTQWSTRQLRESGVYSDVPGISRVVCEISPNPPSTIEWE